MAEFVAALDGRIKSMAATHELLSDRRWQGVPLVEILRRELATYATAIGPHKLQLIALKADGTLDDPSALLQDAHAAGLKVHAYTFRAENQFLPKDLRSDADPHHLGDLQSELEVYLNAGLDGFFTDHADYGVRARDAFDVSKS